MYNNLTPVEKKLLKKSQIGISISLSLVFIPLVLILILQTSDSLAKWMGLFMTVMVLPILYFTWQIMKIAYKDQKDNSNPPLWVPKVYGFGLSINPYHRFGKVIIIAIVLLIAGIIISIILTPASAINH
ncbi:hypothetical protein ACT46E_001814 [Enterococcus faecalis]